MKLKTLTLSLLLSLAASSTFAEDRYLVRVPANVNLSAPETPQAPAEPLSLTLSAYPLPAGMVGTPYEFNLLDRLSINGGTGSHNYSDTTWYLKAGDALPPGLTLMGGLISGTPNSKNQAGTSFEVTGTYQDVSGARIYTIVVEGVALQATQIAAGSSHTCALTIAGGVKCWGDNRHGMLGDGTGVDRTFPADVPGLESGVKSIATGHYHTCALLQSGGVQCWGSNFYGQLGDGTNITRHTPVPIIGVDVDVLDIKGGWGHMCAITHDARMKCWGHNSRGQLGNGTTTWSALPVDVSGINAPVKSFASGYFHNCALLETGNALCWGGNTHGQLGDGTTTDRLVPVSVELDNTQSLHAGYFHTCSIDLIGDVKCWGNNEYGQLGDGLLQSRSTPGNTISLGGKARSMTGGYNHSCALLASGSVKCWGHNEFGQVGDNTAIDRPTPESVTGLDGAARSLTSGYNHMCANLVNGAAQCWGRNLFGQLGDGTNINRLEATDVTP